MLMFNTDFYYVRRTTLIMLIKIVFLKILENLYSTMLSRDTTVLFSLTVKPVPVKAIQ